MELVTGNLRSRATECMRNFRRTTTTIWWRGIICCGLGVEHLRLIFGTSMGCMHSFVWGETYPEFMDALMPMACLPVQIAGRNRVWRKMTMDAIREDPEWNGGEYKEEPKAAVRV